MRGTFTRSGPRPRRHEAQSALGMVPADWATSGPAERARPLLKQRQDSHQAACLRKGTDGARLNRT